VADEENKQESTEGDDGKPTSTQRKMKKLQKKEDKVTNENGNK